MIRGSRTGSTRRTGHLCVPIILSVLRIKQLALLPVCGAERLPKVGPQQRAGRLRAPRVDATLLPLCGTSASFSLRGCGVREGIGCRAKSHSVPQSLRSPSQNPVAECWIGSLHRDLPDHVVALSQHHLVQLVNSYILYYHEDRCHVGLEGDTPEGRLVAPRPSSHAKVVGLHGVGGLHHRYAWRDSA